MALPLHVFVPQLWREWPSYNRERFGKDLSAGITVGIVALPLAIAFGIASGVTPQAGLWTAIIAGFLIALLGGSRVQIGGPAGAYIVIVAGIIDRYGLANLLIATIMAGVLLMAMGLFKLGSWVRFIPVSIVIGFTNGIAVLIGLSQIKDFFGLSVAQLPADVVGQLAALWAARGSVNGSALLLALCCFSYLVVHRRLGRLRFFRYLPAPMVVLALATLVVWAFKLPVETIGSRFGSLPPGLPDFAWPEFSWNSVRTLAAPTLTIALLGAIESLLCARIADQMMGAQKSRHDPNQELMAQGIANVVTPFFGGIPATGTIARTTTNVQAGATSPISGIVHALTLLVIVLAAAPLAAHIPMAALAAILMMAACNMGEWREFARLRQFNLTYRTILLATFACTVLLDLTVAIEVGLVLACLFFIYRMSHLTSVVRVYDEALPPGMRVPEGVAAYRLYGSLFFGTVGKLEALSEPSGNERVMVLDMHHVVSMDTSGLDALEALLHSQLARGAELLICDLNAQPRSLLQRSGFEQRLGPERVLRDVSAALQRADAIAREDATSGPGTHPLAE